MNNTMVPFWKTLTFWISACAWFVAMGGHYAGEIPDPYGVVAANVVAIVYAVLRCLVKRKEGLPWKGILATSEFAGTSATVLLNLLDSLAQVPSMPPKILVGISAAAGFLVTALHHLSGSNSFESAVTNEELAKLVGVSDEKIRQSADPSIYQERSARGRALNRFNDRLTGALVTTTAAEVDKQPGAPTTSTARSEAETPLERPTILGSTPKKE